MAFTFRFETVLKVRKIREDLALQAFSKAQHQYLSLVNMRKQKTLARDDLRRELVARMKRGLSSKDVKQYYDYLSHLEHDISQLSEYVTSAEIQMNSKREDLLKAKKDSKAIERLKEIHQERYQTDQNRKEMRFIDEMAIMRHGGQS
ncbi:MAG: flagellar export protein FliJ [Desulfomonilia bacterium]